MQKFPLIISFMSLIVSLLTFWWANIRKGKLVMTRPTQISITFQDITKNVKPHLGIECMVFSTGNKGNIIENMFVRLITDSSQQDFKEWIHNNNNKREHQISGGIFASTEGVASRHSFFLLTKNESYQFKAGKHSLEIYAQVLGYKNHKLLCTINFALPEHEQQKQINFRLDCIKNEYKLD